MVVKPLQSIKCEISSDMTAGEKDGTVLHLSCPQTEYTV